MWDEFNIKTFDVGTNFDKKYDRPIHIIYVGDIAGNCRLNVNIFVENQPVFLSAKIKNKNPAFLNIFIKNAGKNSEFRGHVIIHNENDIKFNCNALHTAPDTTILLKTKLIAGRNSISKLTGTAEIEKNCNDVNSDISFCALADKTARIEFMPAQRISAVPTSAEHSASIYQPTVQQIEYLRGTGLSGAEVDSAMREAFVNDLDLF